MRINNQLEFEAMVDTSRVLVVTSPNLLHGDVHSKIIDRLCQAHTLVVLMHFGDEKYSFEEDYSLPLNAKLIHYDYESLDKALETLEACLESYGIDLISRHTIGYEKVPFVLSGSILQVPQDVDFSFFTQETRNGLNKTIVTMPEADWDF